jgi:hypothetical protein
MPLIARTHAEDRVRCGNRICRCPCAVSADKRSCPHTLRIVTDPDFDARLARLIRDLDELANLLRDHGETHWLGWVTTCRTELAAHDAAAFDHLLGAYGGMGSLNDLLILGGNGHAVDPGEESAVNVRLDELRTVIWDNATALRHDLRASS